jgi:hypothetical protein
VIVHSYFYGPTGNGGLNLETTRGLTRIINEDVVRELYTKDGHPNRTVQFSNLYQTMTGPVIAATRITPATSKGRQTVINRTFFVRLEDVSAELFQLMDANVSHVEPVQVTLQVVNDNK